MKGAKAEVELKTISTPKSNKTRIIGAIQRSFLFHKKELNSFTKAIIFIHLSPKILFNPAQIHFSNRYH